MVEPSFKHRDLELVSPSFNSPLTALIVELDHLRKKKLEGSTPLKIFFQLKHIFHMLESIGSARIEGNRTTVFDYIEAAKLTSSKKMIPSIQEIFNIEAATNFIDECIEDISIDRAFVSEIHKKIVSHLPLNQEGDSTPGEYRKKEVRIAQSSHLPPQAIQVNDYMEELFRFINREDKKQYDLLKVALAHHRFVWIHPFTNGNGRTVRLLTYAMLVKLGVSISVERILNPTAVFCHDRDKYYTGLSQADTGTEAGLLNWCEYVLKGLKEEIEKIDRLLNYEFLQKKILFPAIQYAIEREHITDVEAKILKCAVNKKVIQAGDLVHVFPGKVSAEISRQIKKLLDKKMLVLEDNRKRKYLISFDNSFLLRGVIKHLTEAGFIAVHDPIS